MKHFWFFIFVIMLFGCNEVEPGSCYPNPAGGAGGAGQIPTGDAVAAAAATGDYITDPPKEPLDYGGDPDPCMAGKISLFGPSDFTFVTIVADDGTGVGGGWQEAPAGLIFGPTPTGATVCVARIGMPLRTYAWGNVPPSIAAIYTAKVANAAADKLEKNGSFDLPPGIFCNAVDTEMRTQFNTLYKGLGASVTVKSP